MVHTLEPEDREGHEFGLGRRGGVGTFTDVIVNGVGSSGFGGFRTGLSSWPRTACGTAFQIKTFGRQCGRRLGGRN